MYHEHPLRIMRYSMKNIWLLIFPLLRSTTILKFDPAAFYAWLKGTWKDIIILGLILIFGFVQWYFSRISVTEKEVIHTNGVIIKITTSIPIENISTVTSERAFYLLPFSAMTLKCDTRAGIMSSTDMKLLVSVKVGKELMSRLPKAKKEEAASETPADMISVLLFSAFFSSGFSGAVYIATFFFKGGDIAHNIVTLGLERLTETTEKITEKTLLKIPKAGLLIGIVFLAAWFLSFMVNILRYSRFRVSSDGKYINISCGITNIKKYRIRSEYINFTDLRQNLVMKICSAVSVNISCSGYGINSNRLPVLMPMRREDNIGSIMEQLGVSGKNSQRFRPSPWGFMSYIGLPLFGAVAIFIIYLNANRFFPQFSELSRFLALMGEIPLLWLVAVKTVALFQSGIIIDDNKIVVKSSKMTEFHTVVADRKNIVITEIQQTIFQQIFKKKCHVIIWFSEEKKSKFIVKSLDVSDAKKICNLL